jgi:AraC-like DNA-binding protein/ligand-binding sensor domain-containing protein
MFKITPPLRFILFLLFSISINTILAQEYEIKVSKVLGLKENIITDVEQDINGFIWISASKNIYKYNNKDFINYSKEDLLLKPQHIAIHITSDSNGNIWYFPSADFQIKILDTKSNKIFTLKEIFNDLPFLESDIISKPYRDDFHNIYISVKNKGLYKFDGKKIILLKSITEENDEVISFVHTKNYNWFAYKNKIIKQHKDNLFEEVITTDINTTKLNIFNNQAVLVRHSHINSHDKFTAKYIKGDNTISVFPNLELQTNYFSDISFYQKTRNNNYWVNEKDYLKQIDKNQKVIYKIKKSDYPFGKRYRTFFVDKNDIIWILTETSLFKATIHEKKFKKYLEGFSLKSIFKRDSSLYITTFDHGIKILDSKNKIHQFNHFNDSQSFIGSIYQQDSLWITRYSEVLNYNFKTNKILQYNKTIKPDSKNLDLASIVRHPKTKSVFIGNSFFFTKLDEVEKTVVIAEHLNKYIDKKDRTNINVRCLQVYGDSIWIGTAKGLFLMDHKEKISRAFTPEIGFPKDLIIQHIYIENDTTFWLGTHGQGLVKWDRLKNNFTIYTTKDGLSNNNVYAVFKDKFGFLWLPTDKGLNRFAPKTLKNNIFLPDEISHQEFNHLSNFEDENGILYFGGLNGLNVINPKNFLITDNISYNLVLNNIKTTLKDNTIVEEKQISNNTIVLNSSIKDLELEFLLLDFKNNLPLQYQYKITPFHNEYLVANKNKIHIPIELKKGKYQLFVKGQSSTGNWSELKAPIEINSEGYDNSTYKLVIFLCLVIGIISFFIIKKVRNKNKTEINKETEDVESIETDVISNTKQNDWLILLNKTILINIESNNFGVEFLSEKMELSERQLQRRIKKITKLTPNKYITEVRLKEAFRLIEEKEVETVKEVSKKVVYTTTEYFSKLFKNKYGKNPSDYLRF